KEELDAFDKAYPLDFEAIGRGVVDFTLARLKDGTPSLRMGLPLVQQSEGRFSQVMAIDLHQERLTALFSEATAYTSFLVDRHGRVLASTDVSKVSLGADVSDNSIVK